MQLKLATLGSRLKSVLSPSSRRSRSGSTTTTTTTSVSAPTVSISTSASTSIEMATFAEPEDVAPPRPSISATPPALKRTSTRFSVRFPKDVVINASELPASAFAATTTTTTTSATDMSNGTDTTSTTATAVATDAAASAETTPSPKVRLAPLPPSSFNSNPRRFSLSALARTPSRSSSTAVPGSSTGASEPAPRSSFSAFRPSFASARRASVDSAYSRFSTRTSATHRSTRTNASRTTLSPAEVRRGHRISLEFAPVGERRDALGREKWDPREADKKSKERRRASLPPLSALSGRGFVPAMPGVCF